jgi:WhiB family redox-sensing transcriptional regulator
MTTMTPPTGHATSPAAPSDGWMRNALCRQVDSSLFFPEGRGGSVVMQTAQAKQVCNLCPVKSACLEWAVDTGQSSGVWGGMSEDERRPLLRAREDQRRSSYDRCIDEQAYIEERAAQGASHVTIADELNVCRVALGRAWRFFQAERQQAASAEAVNAA